MVWTAALEGCAVRTLTDPVPIAETRKEPETTRRVWRINPTNEMVADLIGSEALAACRLALDDYFSCSVAVGSCMHLVILPDQNVLYMDQCGAVEEEMLLKPKSDDAAVKALPLGRRED
jgi:hypothetical protein